MSFLDDEILLGQLVEETFSDSKDLKEFKAYQLTYYSSIECYQLEINNKIYTFPKNWGPFQKVHERQGEGVILEEDAELFNSVFSSLTGEEVKAAFVYKAAETYLVFVPKKMEINFNDLHSFIFDNSETKLAA